MILTTGCAKNQVIQNEVYCIKASPPTLKQLDNNKHICSEENIKTILSNTNKLNKYSSDQESESKCYIDTLKK